MSDQRITYLLQSWTLQSLTPAEEKELFDWVSDLSDPSPVHEHMLKLGEENNNHLVSAVDWEMLYKQILEKRQIDPVPAITQVRTIHRHWLHYAAAAAILVLLTTTIFWLTHKNRSNDQTLAKVNHPSTDDALPGRDRAMLTLANGETILLDSIQGTIVQHENFNVNNQNGKLDYAGKDNTVQYHTLSTPNGGQYKLQLPDGTNVWLNAASSITYPTTFTGTGRKVSISGEVYFEVVKDPSKPFHVKVNDMEVEVLGTNFNINSYSGEEAVKTTLLEGSVQVKKGNDMALLKPGQQAQSATRITVIHDANLDQVMAWKNGSFQFDKTPLSAVMRQLSRWYDVDVVYENGVPNINLGGEMKRDLKLSQVLKGLGKMGVHFRIEGKKLVVLQ